MRACASRGQARRRVRPAARAAEGQEQQEPRAEECSARSRGPQPRRRVESSPVGRPSPARRASMRPMRAREAHVRSSRRRDVSPGARRSARSCGSANSRTRHATGPRPGQAESSERDAAERSSGQPCREHAERLRASAVGSMPSDVRRGDRRPVASAGDRSRAAWRIGRSSSPRCSPELLGPLEPADEPVAAVVADDGPAPVEHPGDPRPSPRDWRSPMASAPGRSGRRPRRPGSRSGCRSRYPRAAAAEREHNATPLTSRCRARSRSSARRTAAMRSNASPIAFRSRQWRMTRSTASARGHRAPDHASVGPGRAPIRRLERGAQ